MFEKIVSNHRLNGYQSIKKGAKTISTKNKRTQRLTFYAAEAERDFIAAKMAAAGITNRCEYLRRMALTGYVVRIDYSDIRELSRLLRNATSNLNQISRRVNESGSIFADDIRDLQRHYENLRQMAEGIKTKLAEM